jgi:hypothetical protein
MSHHRTPLGPAAVPLPPLLCYACQLPLEPLPVGAPIKPAAPLTFSMFDRAGTPLPLSLPPLFRGEDGELLLLPFSFPFGFTSVVLDVLCDLPVQVPRRPMTGALQHRPRLPDASSSLMSDVPRPSFRQSMVRLTFTAPSCCRTSPALPSATRADVAVSRRRLLRPHR